MEAEPAREWEPATGSAPTATPSRTGAAGPAPLPRGLGMRSKLILLSVLPLVLLLAGLLWSLLRHFEASVRSATEAELRDRAAEAADDIERENATFVAMARTMATAASSGLFGQRAVSADFARNMLKVQPNAYGAYFGYETDADGHDRDPANAKLPNGSVDADGRFLPYWFRPQKSSSDVALKPLTGMTDGLWYRGVKNRFDGVTEITGISLEGGVSRLWDANSGRDLDPDRYMITEPYDYEGELIVETTWPIVIGGKFRGVAGMDRTVTRITSELASKRPYGSAQFILISRRGRGCGDRRNRRVRADHAPHRGHAAREPARGRLPRSGRHVLLPRPRQKRSADALLRRCTDRDRQLAPADGSRRDGGPGAAHRRP